MRFFGNEKGNIAIMAALTMSLVVGGAGFGVETGYWYFEQVRLQQAADAAAYAAAVEQRAGSSSEAIEAGASAAAEENGFDPDADEIEVTSPSVIEVDDANSVDVVLRRTVPRAFSAVFTDEPVLVEVRATAAFTTAANACVLALDKSAAAAVSFGGSSQATMTGCIVMSNSLAANAISATGSATIETPCMVSVGGVELSEGVTLTECAAAMTDQPPAADPYQDVEMPGATGCVAHSGSGLAPGCYTGKVDLKNTVNLAPGVYIINGGELKINANALVSGSDVTFFFLGGAEVNINGTATVNLSAPTSGAYSGLLFAGARDNPYSDMKFNGTAASSFTGALYFPTQKVTYQGNFSGANGCTQIVSKLVEWTGNATVNVDCSDFGMADISIGRAVRLVG